MLAAGCSIEVEEQQTPDKYSFYYLNAAETTLEREAYEPKEESADFMVRELMQSIGNRKVPEDGIALLPEEVILNSYDFQDDVLVIDFSAQYHEMSRARVSPYQSRDCKNLFAGAGYPPCSIYCGGAGAYGFPEQ